MNLKLPWHSKSAEPYTLRDLPRRVLLSEYFVLYLTIVYVILLLPFIPWLLNPMNIKNILSNAWPLLALAMGQTFVLIVIGVPDLSQTSIMALTSVVGAVVMSNYFDPVLFSKSPLWGSLITENGGIFAGTSLATLGGVVVMLSVGLLIGLFNGISVALFKMPPFMVTLVGWNLWAAIATFLPKSENIRHLPEGFVAIGSGNIGPISIAMLVALLLAVSGHFVLSKTLFGKRVYATGLNPKAAKVCGIPTKRIIIAVYMVSGLCAAVGSILYSARLEMGRPTMGSTLLLDIIGANIIAGISLYGGKGKVSWTFFGVFFFIILANSLNHLNLPFYMIDIVKGSIICLAAVLDVVRTRASERRVYT